MNILNYTIDKHITKKVDTIRPRDKVFMNSTIRMLMSKGNRVHYKAVKTQNPLHWARYRYLRNQVIDKIRSSRQNYNKKLSAQINKSIPPGKWWRILKSSSKLNNKHKPLPPLKVDGQTLFICKISFLLPIKAIVQINHSTLTDEREPSVLIPSRIMFCVEKIRLVTEQI